MNLSDIEAFEYEELPNLVVYSSGLPSGIKVKSGNESGYFKDFKYFVIDTYCIYMQIKIHCLHTILYIYLIY